MPPARPERLRLPEVVETARLRLRPPRHADTTRIVPLLDDWEVARWLARVPHPYTAADHHAYVVRAEALAAAGQGRAYTIVLHDGDEPIGGIGLGQAEDPDAAELGFWLGRPFWGRGYATEAVRALTATAFENTKLARVFATSLPENASSQRVQAKAGLAFVGMRDYDFALRGGVRPAPCHEITRAEFERMSSSNDHRGRRP